MTVAKAIKTWRDKYSITQEDVAKLLGVTTRTVSRWETGKFAPDANDLRALDKRWPGLMTLVMR